MNALPRKLQAQQGPVWIYNPLPEALHHYEESLFEVLAASKWGRARAALAELGAHAQSGREHGHLIVCWPTYGLLEPALWLPTWRGSTVSIVVHYPSPLRPQLGMGRIAAALGGRAARA